MQDFALVSNGADFEVSPKKTKIRILEKCGPGRIAPTAEGLTTYTALLRNSVFCYVALKEPDIKPLTEVFREELLEIDSGFDGRRIFFAQNPQIELTQANIDVDSVAEPSAPPKKEGGIKHSENVNSAPPKKDIMDITRELCLRFK